MRLANRSLQRGNRRHRPDHQEGLEFVAETRCMDNGLVRTRDSAATLVLLVSLYTFELSGLLLAIAIPRSGGKPILSFLASRPGLFCLVAFPILVASSAVIVHQYRMSRRTGSRQFGLVVMMNLVTVLILLTVGELAIRVFSFQTTEGLVFMNISLLPRSWGDVVVRNHEILKRASTNDPYLVYDDLMGWTIGSNRRSADGLNFSSVEGIRSPRSEMAFADLPVTYRIALIGDSFTFCLDVKYEESWGNQLERALGPEFQVLNFGVPGYGLDQAYLRYYRDVRPWDPDVVIFGVFPHDLERTMTVYNLVSFPEWEYPFAKSRFVMNGERLAILNVPPLTPEAIFSKSSIKDLPFIEYDRGYNQADWQWRYYHHSHLLRFLISRYPLWPVPSQDVSEVAMKSVNSELMRSFVRLATAEHSIPIVVYLPARKDLRASSPHPEGAMGFEQSVLRSAGIAYTDLTPCLLEVSPFDRFVVGARHYSPQANAAIANCLREVLVRHLS